MVAGWKLRRELVRLGQQLRAIPELVWEPLLQRAHDRQAARGFPVAAGGQTRGAQVAVVLVYQPGGMAGSLPVMCDHLVARGYAPFIIANAPLAPADRAALLPHVWRIMDRPNFGYDFGGYRDALRALRAESGLARVLILNDSIWFPLDPDEELIARLEGAGADVAGTILRVRDETRFLESYCYLIAGHVLEDARVRAFWDGLKLTSNKYKVIRRGERAHSVMLAEAGFTLAPVYREEDFLARLEGEDDAFLRKTLQYGAFQEAEDEAARARLLAAPDGPDWRARALAFVARTLRRGQFYSQFPFAVTRLMGYPILKKSGDRPSTLWRAAYARAVAAGDLPAPPEPCWSEIRARVQRDSAA